MPSRTHPAAIGAAILLMSGSAGAQSGAGLQDHVVYDATDINAAFATKQDLATAVNLGNFGTTPVTPSGGATAPLAALLAGVVPLPALQTNGTTPVLGTQVIGGAPVNFGVLHQVTTSLDNQHFEAGTEIDLHAVTGFGGNAASVANGKVDLEAETVAEAAAGNVWDLDSNLILRQGWAGNGLAGAYGYEQDVTNQSGQDCAPADPSVAKCFLYGTWIATAYSTQPGTAALQIVSNDASEPDVYGWHYGILLGSGRTVQDISVVDQGNSLVSYKDVGTHGIAGFWDASTSPTALNLTGSYSTADINDVASGPAGLAIGGNHSLASISTQTDAATNALVIKDGQHICFAQTDACLMHTNGKLTYAVGGTAVFSVDANGNAVFKGGVTGNGTP